MAANLQLALVGLKIGVSPPERISKTEALKFKFTMAVPSLYGGRVSGSVMAKSIRSLLLFRISTHSVVVIRLAMDLRHVGRQWQVKSRNSLFSTKKNNSDFTPPPLQKDLVDDVNAVKDGSGC
jgi:hypothetical protein